MKYPAIISPMLVAAALKRPAEIGATLEDDFMSLPVSNSPAAWEAFLANPNMTGVRPEDIAERYDVFLQMVPRRETEEAFLVTKLREQITEQARSRLKQWCPAHARKEVLAEVMHVLMVGMLEPKSSESDGLRTAFGPTVHFRTIDAIRRWYDTNKVLVPLDGVPELADPAAEGEAETGASYQHAIRKMKPEDAAAIQARITGIQPSVKVAERTEKRRVASARGIIFNEFETTKFATEFNLDLPAPETPTSMPSWISSREIYTLAFAYSCPRPTDADVETWCGYFPTAADDIRECARFMRLDVAQVLALNLADA